MKSINRYPGVLMNICVKWYSPMTSNDFVITVTSKDRRKSFPIPQDKHTKIYQIIQNIIGIIMYVQNRTGIFFCMCQNYTGMVLCTVSKTIIPVRFCCTK